MIRLLDFELSDEVEIKIKITKNRFDNSYSIEALSNNHKILDRVLAWTRYDLNDFIDLISKRIKTITMTKDEADRYEEI